MELVGLCFLVYYRLKFFFFICICSILKCDRVSCGGSMRSRYAITLTNIRLAIFIHHHRHLQVFEMHTHTHMLTRTTNRPDDDCMHILRSINNKDVLEPFISTKCVNWLIVFWLYGFDRALRVHSVASRAHTHKHFSNEIVRQTPINSQALFLSIFAAWTCYRTSIMFDTTCAWHTHESIEALGNRCW